MTLGDRPEPLGLVDNGGKGLRVALVVGDLTPDNLGRDL